jgi:hypothetical protein
MGRTITIVVLALAGALVLAGAALAAGCPYCSDGCDFCCFEPGTGNWIEATGYVNDVDDLEEPPLYTWGVYPADCSTSGRLHYSTDYLSRSRFELRWQDLTSDTLRGWGRIAVFPLTIEGDEFFYDGYTWDHYQDETALQFQARDFYDYKLRFHDGELDNMLLRYEGGDYQRAEGARLTDYEFKRLTYQYNFDLACGRIRGQLRQTATSSQRPRLGPGDYVTDQSMLKLDAKLSDEWSAYGRGSYTNYDYEDLPDDEFDSHKYTLGLRYRPDLKWEFDVSYGTRDYATDNVISSHADSSESYGFALNYAPCGGSWYEAGYRHTSFDYTQLHVQDPALKPQLRSGAVLTQGDVVNSVTAWTPEQDEFYAGGTHRFSDRLTGTGRVSYFTGDMPGSDLVEAASPSLFFDERVTGLGTLTYDYDSRNQFSLSGYNQESNNTERESDFAMSYIEGSWTRCVTENGFLTLGVRDTRLDLSTTFVEDEYTTDDMSYMVGFSHELNDFSYAVDFTLTDATGSDEYEQTAAGMDLRLKSLGPIGIRVDWFDRDYAAFPEFNSEALEVGLSYTLKF